MKKIFLRLLAISLIMSFALGSVSYAEDFTPDSSGDKTAALQSTDDIPPIGHRILNYHFVDNDKTMTDEEFFGKYDSETDTWVIPSKFDYDKWQQLGDVKQAAMDANGDYTQAKELFKQYYKEKVKSFNIEAPANNPAADELAAKIESEQMYFGTGTTPLDIISFDNEKKTVEVDITAKVEKAKGLDVKTVSMVIMGLRKDGSSAEIDSREAGSTGPVIDVQLATGATMSFKAEKDTYVSAGDNRERSYGTEEVLKAEESVSSIGTTERVDTNTKRTSVAFNLDRLSEDDSITSATLKLCGKNAAGTGKMYLVIFLNDTANWTEDTAWVNYPNGHIAFSYYGEEYQLNHKMLSKNADIYPNANFRYTEDICRVAFTAPFYRRYYYTRDEFYAQAYIKSVGDFMLQHSGEAAVNKTLDLANRRVFATNLPIIIQSEYATAEWVTAVAKHLWGAANYMKTRFTRASNWGTAEASQLYAIAAYFPEFKDAYDWMSNMSTSQNLRSALYRVKSVLDEDIRSTDFSCHEHAGAYVNYFISTITTIMSIGDVTGVPLVLDEESKQKLINVTRYLADITAPGFTFTQWGDEGMYTGKHSQFLTIGRKFDDDVLLYAGTDGKEGEKPSHTSIFYPEGKIAAMRTGWDKNSYFLFTDFGGRSTHGHDDDLSLIVFAKGKYLLTDQSMADYSSDQQVTLGQLESHNVVIIDGQEQKSGTKLEETVPGKTNDWVTNDGFDFLAGTIEDKGDNSWKRNVMFLRGNLWIVTDYMVPSDLTKDVTYRQLWHMLSNANPTFDENTKELRSNFEDVNIRVIPLESDKVTTDILTGLQGGSSVKDANYGAYTKVDKGITSMDVVLRPESATENAEVKTSKISLPDVSDNGATAMNIDIASTEGSVRKETKGVYYLVSDDSQINNRQVNDLKYNGKMFYWETDKNGIYTNLNIYKGGELVGKNGITLFKYADKINDFSAKFGGKTIYLSSSLTKDDIDWSKLTFAKQGDIAQVYYNGEKISFKQTDNYIYFGSEPVIWDPSTPSDPDSGGGGSGGGGGGGHGSSGGGTKQTDSTPAVKNDLQLNKEKGVAYIKGYDNGLIQPDKPITRGEVVTALYRLVLNKEEDKKGKVEFTDVSESNFAYDAIEFMQRKNIISGYEDNTFRAENGITRGEFAKIISSFAESAIKDNGTCPFTDISSSWAKDYIKKVFYAGWINGYPDKTYRPDSNITRAEFTAIINKVLGRVPDKDKAKEYENYFTDINTAHWAFADMIEASVENYGNALAE